VTQHGCLATVDSLLGNGDNGTEIVYGEGKICCTMPTRIAKTEQNLLYLHVNPNIPTKEGPLSFVLFESPFTSVSTVSRGHPSLVSLLMLYLNPRFSGLDRQLTEVDAIVVHHLFTWSIQS
jgi:hypothetical protein